MHCLTSDIHCVVDNGTNYKAAAAGVLLAGNIRRGVGLGGVTGNYPSATSPLLRYSDSGATTGTAGADETDLTSFATQLKTAGTFEFWDENGVRRTGSGDADIVVGNIRDTVAFENLGVTGTYTGGAPSVWDLRAGVIVGSVTGKLKVNCRNSTNSVYYNYDGAVASLPTTGVTTGTTYDSWDTIDDRNGQPDSSGFPAAWSVTSNYCGGVESVTDDDNVWRDVTTTAASAPSTCTADDARCTMKDKISGVEWSKTIQTSRTWPQAINDCDALIHNGASDWRLPTLKELKNAHEHGIMSAPSTNWITVAQMQSGFFWSSSTLSITTSDAWVQNLSYGTSATSAKTGLYRVACVR